RSRRDVLTAGAVGLASMAIGKTARAADEQATTPGNARSDEPLPAMLKTSLAGYSFREYLDKPGKPCRMSLFDLADYAARLGIDAYEPTFYYFLKTDDEYIYSLKRKIILTGLEI